MRETIAHMENGIKDAETMIWREDGQKYLFQAKRVRSFYLLTYFLSCVHPSFCRVWIAVFCSFLCRWPRVGPGQSPPYPVTFPSSSLSFSIFSFFPSLIHASSIFLYTSRAYATMSVSACLSVTEVHWRIIANLRFKFRSKFTANCRHREGL